MDIQRDRDIDLNYVYGWNYNMLKFIGIWPEERKWNRSSSYFILLPCIVMVCFICAPQTINLPIIAGDSDLVIENLSTNITITISLMKTMAVWIKGKPLKSLLKCMANDWDTVTNNADREKMVTIARITKKITIRSILLANIVVAAFLPARLSSMIYNDKELFYRGYYPYNTTISPNFELTLIGQLMAALYTAITYTTVDTFVVLLIFHVCGQLSILRDDLRKIHSYDDKSVEMKLQKIVQKHVYINRFAETIEDSFNMMLLFQMLGCTTQLCSQTYQVLMSLGEEAIEHMILQITFLLIYVIYVMLQLLLYCYMGEKLTIESTEIANTAYNAEWYNLPPKNARWLVIIMCRARSSPLQITAGRFCCFTLVLYSQSNTQSVSEADLEALHPATFPYDNSKSQNFEIAWPGQFMSSVLTAICYSCFDTFLAVLVLYLCGQLTVLRMALEDPTYATKKNNYARFYERLGFTVNQDNQLSRFAAILEDRFNFTILIRVIICTSLYCLTGCRMITSVNQVQADLPIVGMIFLIIHVMYTVLLLLTYDHVGEMLRGQSAGVGQSVYDCNWHLPPKDIISLIIVVCRAKVSFQGTAEKFSSFSLEFDTVNQTIIELNYFFVVFYKHLNMHLKSSK
ncbi:odorant receptor 13a-like isoform X2 [Bombus affinis]|uniref:odorant receptor 13a-like isoform X2 n=1 Tax=Bombus affinis TaxID=309941 RepID=UPI0021B80E83|nr:odorant receptor 13a-like isoform X2 [Bombus affinis]